MDLTQLEMFNAVAEAGSITQAAAKVHRVPSNLTTRLRQLETELGVDLFIRENQRLRLSPAGHNFLRYSQQILALVDEARSVVAGDEPQGLFSLGSLESTAAVQFKLTYPARNGRHKENIEFQVVINLSPIYLDNFRHDGEINIFCAPNPKPVTMGRVFQTGVERVLFLFLNDFIEQFPMINPGVPIKRAHTPHIEPLPSDHHTAADYLRQFDLLVLNFISRGNFVILPRLWNNSEVHRWFVNKDPNLITAILDITDSELKEDLLQSLMDSLGSNKHVLPEVCICFLSLLAEQESPHFQNLFLFFANMLLHYHQFMNPNESDLNDVLMPASLSDDKIIKHMARRTLKLFVKNETPPKVTHEDLVKNRPRSPVRPPIPATAKTPDLPERH